MDYQTTDQSWATQAPDPKPKHHHHPTHHDFYDASHTASRPGTSIIAHDHGTWHHHHGTDGSLLIHNADAFHYGSYTGPDHGHDSNVISAIPERYVEYGEAGHTHEEDPPA